VKSVPELRLDPAREQADLREYLGARFEPERLRHHQAPVDAEFASVGDEDVFYRTSESYLYDLTAFAMSKTKLPYLVELVRHLAPGARILDYGCGIGSDGLVLLDAGYRVEFADFDNPSARYLRWRLGRRGLDAPVHDLDQAVPSGFDAAYAFDVIEHVRDPMAFLGELELRARLVEVNLLEPGPDDPALHYELPIDALLAHAARHRVRAYRLLYGRSHLVLYEAAPASAAWRLASRGRLLSRRMYRHSQHACSALVKRHVRRP
jgi:SAM-dependent methyltransferase